MACVVDDREGAVREVAQVYELIKIHQPLLLLHCSSSQPPSPATTQLAQTLLGEALRALNVALSVMKQPPAAAAASPVTPSVKAEPQLSSPGLAEAADSEAITSTARRGKRRRSVIEGKNTSSWVNLTTVPYEDGYEWRKYGEKKINGTQFTRNYFRCTYKDDRGCQATKHIQQKDNNDPPMFQVTYNNEHTCNCNNTTTTANNSYNNLPSPGYCHSSEGIVSPDNDHSASIKQEPLVLPPLADVSAHPSNDHQPPCQDPIPVNSQFRGTEIEQHAAILSTTSTPDSSCISGVSCYEYSEDMGQMATAAMEPEAGDDSFHDLELFLLYDSFKYY
ncbi:hypothetical protein ACP70R_021675 [Stipagrostis hirtigluma subsp. patula]